MVDAGQTWATLKQPDGGKVMKKLVYLVAITGVVAFIFSCEQKMTPMDSPKLKDGSFVTQNTVNGVEECITIQSGELLTSDGEPIPVGFNEWGYNYQAYIFNGMYCDYHPIYRPGGIYHEWCDVNYGDVKLVMKWNDAWLSNKDCDGDGLLDRHYGFVSYIGSGAWTTNHMSGGQGEDKWTYFVKIVAAPFGAYVENDVWYAADGTEIGPVIWGSFAIIQEVVSGEGAIYVSPLAPGFGKYRP